MSFPDFEDKETLREVMGLRFFDASNITPLQIPVLAGNEGSILPLMNFETKTTKEATFQKHYKFCILEKLTGTDKDKIYKSGMLVLKVFGDLLPNMFDGRCCEGKVGMLCFDNEYDTTLRIWTTKKVGKNLFYEATVSGYKDAVEKPMKAEKKEWTKIVVRTGGDC
jgi:hypothetical protein